LLSSKVSLVSSLCLALPGLVEPSGVLRAAPNLGAADVGIELGADYGRPLSEVLSRAGASVGDSSVIYDNDATCAAYGEARAGAAAGEGDVLVISFGTGIGAGIVSGGRVWRGAHGFAGEIGHMVINPDGPPCPCGRRGCWERYASGPGLVNLANQRSGHRGPETRAEGVVAAAQMGDAAAIEAIEEFAHYVALGLANAVELLDPARIVLGGGLMQAGEVLFEPIVRAYVAMNRPAQHRLASDLVRATLGDRAAVVGAGLLALEHLG
jgi:glucokinase